VQDVRISLWSVADEDLVNPRTICKQCLNLDRTQKCFNFLCLFCWHILNFAGAVFEVKVAPANNLRQQNFAGAAPENTNTGRAGSY
jgi:hypothetical protein